MEPIKKGELKANDAVIFFDNICDKTGRKLTKSEKRSRLKELMKEVYAFPEMNNCVLSDGRTYPLIVCRQNPGRAKSYYFNNVDAPEKEVLQAFADKTGIVYKKEKIPQKQEGEMIANDAKQFLDEISTDNQKLTGFLKLEKLHELFAEIYRKPEENICQTPEGEIPIVVKRKAINNKTMLCLNTSRYRQEVFFAFAQKVGAKYLVEKENEEIPSSKQKGEMTARECARIFHNPDSIIDKDIKKTTSTKLVQWFDYIYANPRLNRVNLPNKREVPLLLHRQSMAQRCICLNTSDETVKPFVIRRLAALIRADVCLDNLTFSKDNGKELYKAMILLNKAEYQAQNPKDGAYYHAYAQKIYEHLSLPDKEITLTNYLKKHHPVKSVE